MKSGMHRETRLLSVGLGVICSTAHHVMFAPYFTIAVNECDTFFVTPHALGAIVFLRNL